MNFRSLVLSIVLGFGLIACTHRTPVTPQNMVPLAATLPSIQANIFTPKCVNAGCHPGGGAPMSLADGLSYANLVGVVSPAYSMQRVQPGNAMRSVLYQKVMNRLGAVMPPNGKLTQAETDTIAAWINRGALKN